MSDEFEMTRADKRWSGVYMQDGEESEMIFDNMNIWNNRITGHGTDPVGEFDINGDFNPDGSVNFVKQYIGQHNVHYSG